MISATSKVNDNTTILSLINGTLLKHIYRNTIDMNVNDNIDILSSLHIHSMRHLKYILDDAHNNVLLSINNLKIFKHVKSHYFTRVDSPILYGLILYNGIDTILKNKIVDFTPVHINLRYIKCVLYCDKTVNMYAFDRYVKIIKTYKFHL